MTRNRIIKITRYFLFTALSAVDVATHGDLIYEYIDLSRRDFHDIEHYISVRNLICVKSFILCMAGATYFYATTIFF